MKLMEFNYSSFSLFNGINWTHTLTQFWPMFPIYNLWKQQEAFGFLVFSGFLNANSHQKWVIVKFGDCIIKSLFFFSLMLGLFFLFYIVFSATVRPVNAWICDSWQILLGSDGVDLIIKLKFLILGLLK